MRHWIKWNIRVNESPEKMVPARPGPTVYGIPEVNRYRFHLEFEDSVRLPAHAGSAIRGLLGYGLRRTVCVTGARTCQGCSLAASCAYYGFFEGGQGVNGLSSRAAPRPYVLDVSLSSARQIPAGGSYPFILTLLGTAPSLLPYILVALQRAGQRGLGREDARFRLARVDQEAHLGREDWTAIARDDAPDIRPITTAAIAPPALTGPVRLTLSTPLRIKRQGRLVGAREFQLRHLLDALRFRFADLQRFAGKQEPGGHSASLPVPAAGALVEAALQWRDWTRYSTRQGASMQMGGLMGELTLDAAPLGHWLSLLWYGQWVHIGKATTMGLGAYRFEVAPSL